jgi:signal transduction histidine kinase
MSSLADKVLRRKSHQSLSVSKSVLQSLSSARGADLLNLAPLSSSTPNARKPPSPSAGVAGLYGLIVGKKCESGNVETLRANVSARNPADSIARRFLVPIDNRTALIALAIVVLAALATYFVYRFAAASQARDLAALTQSTARVKAVSVRSTFMQIQESIFSLRSNLERTGTTDFDALASEALSRQKGLLAVGWIPVTVGNESWKLARLHVAQGANVPTAKVSGLIGTNFASNPAWMKAISISKSLNTGQIAFANFGIGDALIFQAVKSSPPQESAKGYLVLAVAMKTLIDDSLQSAEAPLPADNFQLNVVDMSEGIEPKLLFSAGNMSADPGINANPSTPKANNTLLLQSADFGVLSRVWQVRVQPTAEFSIERASGVLPLVLLLGAGMTALLLGALFVVRRYQAAQGQLQSQPSRHASMSNSNADSDPIADAEKIVSTDLAKPVAVAAIHHASPALAKAAVHDAVTDNELRRLQAEKSNALSSMLGGIAYELHAPLGAVRTNIQKLLDINEQLVTVAEDQARLVQTTQSWKYIPPTAPIAAAPTCAKLDGPAFVKSTAPVTEDLTDSMAGLKLRHPNWQSLEPIDAQPGVQPNVQSLRPAATHQQTSTRIAHPLSMEPVIMPMYDVLDEMKLRDMSADADVVIIEILKGLQQVGDVARSLKDFSRADRNMAAAVDLHQCIDNTLHVAQNVTRNKAEVTKKYGAIPLIQCNPSQINQVIFDLVSNAARSIEGFGRIVISTRAEGETVVIDIADNGGGLSADEAAHIFEPFVAGDESCAGTHSSLATCEQIIRSHEGALSVTSALGAGSTFSIRLPLYGPAKPSETAALT